MPAGLTFEPIATYTFTGSQTEVTFNSLNQSYTHLFLLMSLQVAVDSDNFYLKFNNDGGDNYAYTRMGFTTSGRGSSRGNGTNQLVMYSQYGSMANTPNVAEVWIPHYTNTNMQKNIQLRASGGAETSRVSGFWNSVSAINSITVSNDGYVFASGSTVTIFGIAEA